MVLKETSRYFFSLLCWASAAGSHCSCFLCFEVVGCIRSWDSVILIRIKSLGSRDQSQCFLSLMLRPSLTSTCSRDYWRSHWHEMKEFGQRCVQVSPVILFWSCGNSAMKGSGNHTPVLNDWSRLRHHVMTWRTIKGKPRPVLCDWRLNTTSKKQSDFGLSSNAAKQTFLFESSLRDKLRNAWGTFISKDGWRFNEVNFSIFKFAPTFHHFYITANVSLNVFGKKWKHLF